MPSSGDVFELKLKGLWGGEEQTLNIFHYVLGTVGTDVNFSEGLADAFDLINVTNILPVCGGFMVYTEIETFCYPDPSDYHFLELTSRVGSASGERTPKFLAWGFRYERTALGQTYGYKRFGGLTEAQVLAGNPTAITLGLLEDLADSLEQTLTSAGGSTFEPIVVSGPRSYGVNPAHRSVETVTFRGVTTQNSRKR